MDIVKDTRNELFKRNELIFSLNANKNPGFDVVRKNISEELGKDEANIDVYNIKGNFGRNSFVISANVYDSKEDLDSIKKLEMTSKQRKESLKDSGKKVEEKPKEVSEEKVEGQKDG